MLNYRWAPEASGVKAFSKENWVQSPRPSLVADFVTVTVYRLKMNLCRNKKESLLQQGLGKENMYIVDNRYGFEVRWRGRKVAEFAAYDEAYAFIKGE